MPHFQLPVIVLLSLATLGFLLCSCCKTADEGTPTLRLSIVFNNEPFNQDLQTERGFSCVIEGLDQTILFDTGGNGDVLLGNMQGMQILPGDSDLVLLSHFHGDHTLGLQAITESNPQARVYLPQSFPAEFWARSLRFDPCESKRSKGMDEEWVPPPVPPPGRKRNTTSSQVESRAISNVHK